MAVNLKKPVNLQKAPVKKAAPKVVAKPAAKKQSKLSKVVKKVAPKINAEVQDFKLRLKGAPPVKNPGTINMVESRRAKKR